MQFSITCRSDAIQKLPKNKANILSTFPPSPRQVSKAEGSALATHYDSAFFETSAAEEYECVERVFHEMIREVLREQERCMPLRPLFISEDRSGMRSLRTSNRKEPIGNPVLQEKNSRFKFFNKGKGFKAIFQST